MLIRSLLVIQCFGPFKHLNSHEEVGNKSKLKDTIWINDQILIECLIFLAVLEEHVLVIPIDENQNAQAKWIEQRHTAWVHHADKDQRHHFCLIHASIVSASCIQRVQSWLSCFPCYDAIKFYIGQVLGLWFILKGEDRRWAASIQDSPDHYTNVTEYFENVVRYKHLEESESKDRSCQEVPFCIIIVMLLVSFLCIVDKYKANAEGPLKE